MPSRPPTFRHPGWRPAPDKRPEAQDPYYATQAWKRLRAACLKRDGYQCAEPKCTTPERGRGGRLTAHHIIPRRKGGADTLANLITRCPPCDAAGHPEKGGAWG